MRKHGWLFVLATILLISTGCGKSTPIANTYTVSGKVTFPDGKGIKDVVIIYAGLQGGTIQTDSDGKWSATVKGSNVTITPTKEHWSFEPTSRQVSTAENNVNFVGIDLNYTVSGNVLAKGGGQPIVGAIITFSRPFTADEYYGTVTTGVDGTWTKSGLYGYVDLNIKKPGWVFPNTSMLLKEARTDLHFTGVNDDDVTFDLVPDSTELALAVGASVSFTVIGKDASGHVVDIFPVWYISDDWYSDGALSCTKWSTTSIGTLNTTHGNTVIFTAKTPGKVGVCPIIHKYYSSYSKQITINISQ